MSVLEETSSVLPKGASTADSASPWKRRIIWSVIIVALLSAALYAAQRMNMLDLGALGGSDNDEQNVQMWAAAPADGAAVGLSAMGSIPSTQQMNGMIADTTALIETDSTAVENQGEAQLDGVEATIAALDDDATTSIAWATTAVAGIDGATLYDSPGGTEIGNVDIGVRLELGAQTEDGNWLLVAADSASGWVDVSDVVGFSLSKVPVYSSQLGLGVAEALQEPEQTDIDILAADTAGEAATAGGASNQDVAGIAELTEQVPAADAALSVIGTVNIDDGRLNVRYGPGTAFEIIGKAYPDDEYRVLGRDANTEWVLLLLSDDEVGWVSAQYLDFSSSPQELPVLTIDDELTANMLTAVPESTVSLQAESDSTLQTVAYSTTEYQPSALASGSGLEGVIVFESSNGGAIYAVDLSTGQTALLTYGADRRLARMAARWRLCATAVTTGSISSISTAAMSAVSGLDVPVSTRHPGVRTGSGSCSASEGTTKSVGRWVQCASPRIPATRMRYLCERTNTAWLSWIRTATTTSNLRH